jgi:peptidylprolyl isomerase
VRKTTALIAAFGILASLTACAGGAGSNGCDPLVSSGDASSAVSAPGEFGTAPTVDLPVPLYTKTTQRSEIIAGKGAPIQDGQPVIVDVTVLNGTDGSVLQKTSYAKSGGSVITIGKSSLPAVSKGLQCSTVGSRVAIVGSPKDSHGGQASSGLAKNDAVVYVIDVKSAFPARADGADQLPINGLPAVVLAPNGAPGITLPHTAPPQDFSATLLKKGDGAKVANGDFVIVKDTGINWADNSVFSSSWKTGQASAIGVGASSVVAGLSKGLTGQRVGSQVLIVVPPKLATSDGSDTSTTVPTDATLVYVVDILGIAK